jgi:hypothetical protein
MNWRELVKTKTFWVGVIAILGGVVEAVFDGWDQGINKMLIGAALIGAKKSNASPMKRVESVDVTKGSNG